MTQSRISECFADGTKKLVTYSMAGLPTLEKNADFLHELAEAGADVIELGFPFSDPVADGPVIQDFALEAIEKGITLKDCLTIVEKFRQKNTHTPVILMGYYNPILHYGETEFVADAAKAGVDGFIVVDVPPEEENTLLTECNQHALSLIKLTTPTTTEARASTVLQHASGFVYFVSITGITGSKKAATEDVQQHIARLKQATNLPICIGFGIKTAEDAAQFAPLADGVVVGTALLNTLKQKGKEEALQLVRSLKAAI